MELVSKRGTALLVSEDHFRSMRETDYLMRSPANAVRLMESVEQARSGQAEQHELLEDGD